MDKRDCIYPDCRLKSKDGFVSCEHSCPFWDTAKEEGTAADCNDAFREITKAFEREDEQT
jgi:predicted ArsR family transcriptional regulator